MEFKHVVIDDFDAHVDSVSGPAEELVYDLYGAKVSERTAESIISGARKHVNKKKELLKDDVEFTEEEYEFASDGSRTVSKTIILSESEMQDDATIMRKMGLDPIQWTLESAKFYRKAYQTPMKLHGGYDKDGKALPDKPHKETSYSYNCEIRVEPIQTKVSTKDVLNAIQEIEAPSAPRGSYKRINNGRALEVPIFDPHWGLHAWEKETGDANWDLKITERVFREVITDILRKADDHYEIIYYPIGQDTFHVDNIKNATSFGTVMDTDGRWPKIYSTGLQNNIWAIEQLRQRGPVMVFYVPGNHDEMLAYAATQSIAHYYRDQEDVTVPGCPFPNPNRRKYVRFGVNQIGFCHGEKETKKNLEGSMQIEDKENWGETVFHEMHLGHEHEESTWETNGITFRRISSICPVSSWEHGKGYHTIRKALAYEWDKELGLDGIIPANVRI